MPDCLRHAGAAAHVGLLKGSGFASGGQSASAGVVSHAGLHVALGLEKKQKIDTTIRYEYLGTVLLLAVKWQGLLLDRHAQNRTVVRPLIAVEGD